MANIKEKIEEIVKKISSDKGFAEKFKKDPISAVEAVIGIDLPNDQIEAIVDAVKAKIDMDKLSGMLDSDGDGKPDLGALGKLGGMFGKK